MGVGFQVALYLVVMSMLSLIAFHFGIVTNPYVSFSLMVISSVVAQQLTSRYYNSKLKRKGSIKK